ncbi:MAG: EsaB/YukD family protein [Streptococcaceae bacterium]|jgi:uncharacterized ubiquitin-like protein YukD|nr:EsaB/YukD family protein [Streptococcaceae bacterium]
MKSHIDISLKYRESQYDLRLPREVSMARLSELLEKALRGKGRELPENWQLVLENKTFKLTHDDRLSELPIGDGDVFQIITEP